MLKRFSNLATSETDWDWLYPPICYITKIKNCSFNFSRIGIGKTFLHVFWKQQEQTNSQFSNQLSFPLTSSIAVKGLRKGSTLCALCSSHFIPFLGSARDLPGTSTVWQIRQATALNGTCIQYINVVWCINEGNLPPQKKYLPPGAPVQILLPGDMTTCMLEHDHISCHRPCVVVRSVVFLCGARFGFNYSDLFGPFHPKCQSALRLMCLPCFFQSYWYFKTS